MSDQTKRKIANPVNPCLISKDLDGSTFAVQLYETDLIQQGIGSGMGLFLHFIFLSCLHSLYASFLGIKVKAMVPLKSQSHHNNPGYTLIDSFNDPLGTLNQGCSATCLASCRNASQPLYQYSTNDSKARTILTRQANLFFHFG